MGQWSTRKRRGGGQHATAPLNFITNAVITGGAESTLTYNAPISVAGFDAGDFHSDPSGEDGDSLLQVGPQEIGVQYGGPIAGDTSTTYDGPNPLVVTPQTIAY